jgi:radical SAM protein with 4Fe4S-binding SPASM domain
MAAISVDGPRDYHDAFRGKVGSYDAAFRAITALKKIGVAEVVAGTTVNRQNADLLADLVHDILASDADSWGFHLVTPEGRASENMDLLPTRHQLRRVAGLGRRLRAIFHVELDNEWGSAGKDDVFYRDDSFMCGAGRFSCVVSATGEVMPCTTTDHSESAGNVRDRPLAEIWANGFSAFRTDGNGAKSDCSDCWLNTRHGHSCRPAFQADLFDEEPHSRLVPLVRIRSRQAAAP